MDGIDCPAHEPGDFRRALGVLITQLPVFSSARWMISSSFAGRSGLRVFAQAGWCVRMACCTSSVVSPGKAFRPVAAS